MLPTTADTNTARLSSCSVAPRSGSGKRWHVAGEPGSAPPRGGRPAQRAGTASPLV